MLGLCLTSIDYEEGMVDVFWKGIRGQGGWESRSRDAPHDVFISIGILRVYGSDIPCPYSHLTGSNDQNYYVSKDNFLETYRDFLNRLRDAYSTALKRIHVIVRKSELTPRPKFNIMFLFQSPFGFFTDPSAPSKRKTVFEPDVQCMVEALAKEWQSRPGNPKLYHIATEGWVNRTLTCDGLHPTVQG